MCENSQKFGKNIILLVSDFFGGSWLVENEKISFLLLYNLEEECLLCTLYCFSRCGPGL